LPFDHVALLSDYPAQETKTFLAWLTSIKPVPTSFTPVALSSPTDFSEIYQAAVAALTSVSAEHEQDVALTFHLSPGTPAMAAVWMLLAKTIYPATLIQSSKDQGVVVADIPFEISAEFIPSSRLKQDVRLEQMIAALPPEAPEFDDIIHRSPQMQRLITRARLAAQHDVPVLIEGESGTGKELLARAIHRVSSRGSKPFVAVNCGAIPAELIKSEFFGHKKGSFTGAVTDRKGYFESAHAGTLFLDEIGELPLAAQVKILRVLQEGELTRVGDSRPVKVDVRVIAATNRTLMLEVAAERFRADLFYRLAVAVLLIPPLRERQGDIGLLVDHILERETGKNKKISAAARNSILNHPWPGNVRELLNTLRRAIVWTPGDTIEADDIREALFPVVSQSSDQILGRTMGEGFNVQELMGEVARHYLSRAMEEAHDNKTKAAQMLGLPNYQTLTNWLKKYGLE
jgi:transcriptional regulator with PAS, ATPase and Fis domain